MRNDKEVKTDRDQQILNRLSRIEHRVDSIDQTNAFALRAEATKHLDEVKKIFKRGKRRAQVYLAANGNRGVLDIASYLKMKRQNVGRDLKILGDEGLLEIVDTSGGRDIWGKKSVDRTLRISKYLQEEYGLQADGRPSKGTKSKNHK
jgi:DNA-binding transcriptional ArsR family regulator